MKKIGFLKTDFFIRVGDDRTKNNVQNGNEERDVHQVRLEIDDTATFTPHMADANVDIGMKY